MTLASETREVPHFTAVAVSGIGDLHVEQNSDPSQPESLLIEADQAALRRISSEVHGDTLILKLDHDWWNPLHWFDWLAMDKTIRYTVRMNQVSGLSISGAGSVAGRTIKTGRCAISISGSGRFNLEDLQAIELETRVSGSGDISLSGKSGNHTIRISGSGRMSAEGLETQVTRVRISGSGRADLRVLETLEVEISGAGEVRYSGSPRLSQRISGAGTIRQVAMD